jgi:hypothetical protein
LRSRLRRVGELALPDDERRGGSALLVDRGADRGDLGRGRAAAATDDAGPQAARLRGELGEVVGRRMREDHARAGQARQTDVRERRQHEPVALHRGERVQRGRGTRAVVRAGGRHVQPGEPLGRLLGRDAAERLAVRVEGHQGDDRQRRHRAHRRDRGDELVQVEERLQHEQVDAATLEHLRLLREERALLGVEPLDLPERADRAGDEDVRARDLARLTGEPDGRGVDPLELVLEEVRGELAPVGAERVRLDQLGAGADEARVERDDALRRPQVRLFRAPQPGHRTREQRAHAAVGDDRRPGTQAFLEAARHAGRLVKQ